MGNIDQSGKIGSGGEFAKQATEWPTPNAHDSQGARGAEYAATDRHYKPHDLAMSADQWQTPATDSFRSRGGDRVDEMGLDQQARFWGTPTSRDWKDGASTLENTPVNGLLGRQATVWESSPPAPENATSGDESSGSAPGLLPPSQRKRLNSLFTTWMMGLPLYWLAPAPVNSARAATQLYLCAQRLHLQRLLERSA
jgi:hypothetical protein